MRVRIEREQGFRRPRFSTRSRRVRLWDSRPRRHISIAINGKGDRQRQMGLRFASKHLLPPRHYRNAVEMGEVLGKLTPDHLIIAIFSSLYYFVMTRNCRISLLFVRIKSNRIESSSSACPLPFRLVSNTAHHPMSIQSDRRVLSAVVLHITPLVL